MFVIDDLFMSPFKGLLFIAKEVAKAVEQEKENNRARLMTRLTELHKSLEDGQITEDQFDETESDLLDQLEMMDQ